MLRFSCNIGRDRYINNDLGSFYGRPSTVARFVPTSSCVKSVDMESSRVVDTRHGRVLLHSASDRRSSYLFVWDPITKEEHELPTMPLFSFRYPNSWNAAVFCIAAGCNHLDCHGKPFAVVFVVNNNTMVFNFVYSSEAGRWSEEVTDPFAQQSKDSLMLEPSALVENALYFMLQTKTRILKYNISTREMHMIHLPPACLSERRILLMAIEDGGLGFATVSESNLCLWSREGGSNKDAGWAQKRAIDLKALLPVGALVTPPDVVGFADGIGFIFIETNSGRFGIDLKSSWVKKVHTISGGSIIFPHLSFHTPALGAVAASTGEGSSTGASKVH